MRCRVRQSTKGGSGLEAHRSSNSNSPLRGALGERVGDETVVYDLESKDIHCLSPLAGAVFERCDGQSTRDQIAMRAQEELGRPISADEVSAALAQLESCRLLDTVFIVDGLSRRQAIGKVAFVGATAAFAAPLITSIAAPSARAAGSGLPTGCQCTKNPDCASNHCCKAAGNNDKCNSGCCAADNNGTLCQCSGSTPGSKCNTINLPDPGACGAAGVCVPSSASCDCSAGSC